MLTHLLADVSDGIKPWCLARDYSFLRKNSVNSAWHFIKFHGSLWQVDVKSCGR